MSVTRNDDLPQHSYGSGAHYGELPLAALPASGANTGDVYYFSGSNWTIAALSGLAVTGVGGSGSITVAEQDGSPSVANVTTIKFSGSTVTNEGSGVVLIRTTASGSTPFALTVSGGGTEVENVDEIRFIGSTVTDNTSGVITVSTSTRLNVNDESVAQGSVTAIDFLGEGVNADVVGSTAFVTVSGSRTFAFFMGG